MHGRLLIRPSSMYKLTFFPAIAVFGIEATGELHDKAAVTLHALFV